MFLVDDIHFIGDDFTLLVSLREVIAHRNRLCGSWREAAASRANLRVDRIQARRYGLRACGHHR